MRIGGRGRQSTRKDTDQTKELAAKEASADTKKGRSTRKEPGGKNDRGGILLRKKRKECRGMMIRIGTTSEPEGTLLKKRRSSRIGDRGLRSESNHSLTGRSGKIILLTKRGRPVAREERRLTNSGLLALLQMLFS